MHLSYILIDTFLKYIKYYYFYTYLVLFLMNIIKLSVLKNRLSGILSVGLPSFSVVRSILSVVGIPPVPITITEEIQFLIYLDTNSSKVMSKNFFLK
jgi:hypothetical protein